MTKFKITATHRGLVDTEIVSGNTILIAISNFYEKFGYQEIIKIEVLD